MASETDLPMPAGEGAKSFLTVPVGTREARSHPNPLRRPLTEDVVSEEALETGRAPPVPVGTREARSPPNPAGGAASSGGPSCAAIGLSDSSGVSAACHRLPVSSTTPAATPEKAGGTSARLMGGMFAQRGRPPSSGSV